MVFALAGDRVWVTTSRGSVKASAWLLDERVAGVVRAGDRAVAFTGVVATYDLLDPETWGRSLREGPLIALASVRFTRRNARFFAGYAVDAHRVPFAWTPPGRVFAELRIERSVVFEDGALASVWGDWAAEVGSSDRFRATRIGDPPLGLLPADVGPALGTGGDAVLALATSGGPVALPVRWLTEGDSVYAAVSEEALGLSGAGPQVASALAIDRPSWWRASEMVGAMVRGQGEIAVAGRLTSGGRSASRIAALAGLEAPDAALVRIRPERVVWWRGWSSGTVTPG
jgi:hypothetical protein